MAAILLCGLCIMNTGYRFDGSFGRLDAYRFGRHALAEIGVPASRWLAGIPMPLPEPYLRGVDEIGAWFDRPHQSYLRGRWSAEGWWYYYLYGLGVKVPLGTWLLVLAASVLPLCQRHHRQVDADEVFLLVPAALVLWFVTASSSYQSHVRYVLPALPFLFLWASRLALLVQLRSWVAVLTAGALLWSIISSLSAYPHCISYFNELAGGTANGDKHLIDSNIDWGQDLHELRRWFERHPDARPFYLAYFGGVDPRLAGIDFALPRQLPQGNGASTRDAMDRWPAGWYAISVNFLHGLPFGAPDGRGAWLPTATGQYSYFRECEPAARAGYSICIYQIGPDGADFAPTTHSE